MNINQLKALEGVTPFSESDTTEVSFILRKTQLRRTQAGQAKQCSYSSNKLHQTWSAE